MMLTGVFLLLAFALQLFAYTKGNLLLNKLLGIIFLIRGVQALFFLMVSMGINTHMIYVFSLVPVIMFMAPPVIYLYIRSFVYDQSSLRRIDLIHFIPVILVILNFIPFFAAPLSLKLEMMRENILDSQFSFQKDLLFIPIKVQFLLRSIILMIYLLFAWRIVIHAVSDRGRKMHSIEKYFLIFFLGLATSQAINSFGTTLFILLFKNPLNNVIHNPGLMVLHTALMFLFIVWILRHPLILYGNMHYTVNNGDNLTENIIPEVIPNESDDSASETKYLLSDYQAAIYNARLNKCMEKDKPFLNPELNIQLLASKIDIPIHHCSFLLNQVLMKSFRDYVNGFRISYFIEVYNQDPKKYTIEFLAQEVGFRNRGTFNVVFKKETGSTPSEYFNL